MNRITTTEEFWKVIEDGEANYYTALLNSDAEVRADKKVALECVKNDGATIWLLNDFHDDRELALEAIKQNIDSLYYVRSKFLDDDEIALVAIEKCERNKKGVNMLKRLSQRVRDKYREALRAKYVQEI